MRICNKALVLAALAITAIFTDPVHAGTNVLQNASFEVGGANNERAIYWDYQWPSNTHGGYWGGASRRDWRAKTGTWLGALPGTWAGYGAYSGFWQEGPATPGQLYEASGWFYADTGGGAFTSQAQNLKIEFYKSDFGTPIGVVTASLFGVVQSFTQKFVRGRAPAGTAWARWVTHVDNTGPNGALQFDDVVLRQIASGDESFNEWSGYDTDGCYTRFDWIVCTGKIQTVDSRSGRCANLGNPGAVATNGHYIMTPNLGSGVGRISFWYRHADGTNAAVTYDVQISADATNWTTVDGITNVLSTNYVQFAKFIYEPTNQYVRLYHMAGAGRLLVDDISIADASPIQRYVDFDDWTLSSSNTVETQGGWVLGTGMVVSANAYGGYSGQILGGTGSSNSLLSPFFADGVGEVSFVYRALTTNTTFTFVLQTSTNGTNWTTASNYASVANTNYARDSVYLYLTNHFYLRFVNLGGSGTNSLILDTINVAEPVLYRSQNFNTWPSENSYGDYNYQGWRIEDARVVDTGNVTSPPVLFSGNAAMLRDTVNLNALVKSPYFADGVGTISFSYLVDETNPPLSGFGVRYLIQTSEDGVTWVTNDTIANMTNYSAFQQYSKYFYITNGVYVRLYHTNGSSRVVIDDISVSAPQPPADVTISAVTSPSAPFTNDSVNVIATIFPVNGAIDLAPTSYYRIGTSGTFTALGMAPTNGALFGTTVAIPPQNMGSTVQYYVRCDFGGPASSSNSPRYYPAGGPTNPASYKIPRIQPGRVWINEVNYLFDGFADPSTDTNEFVEICGPAGVNIGNWRVDFSYSLIANQPFIVYASYTIPEGTVLSNTANGFGFYVLGDEDLAASSMILTNINDVDLTQISDGFYPSGIRLFNEAGGIEQAICYSGQELGFTEVLYEDYINYTDPIDIQLGGTGTSYTNFVWVNTNSMTAGNINTGQSFPASPSTPPTVYFSAMVLGTNITMYFTGNSNSWSIVPEFTTNISAAPQVWQPVTPYFSSTNAVWFDRLTSWWHYVFRLSVTN